jgi:hypothetical protein
MTNVSRQILPVQDKILMIDYLDVHLQRCPHKERRLRERTILLMISVSRRKL